MSDDHEYIKIAIAVLYDLEKLGIMLNALNYLCDTETQWNSKQLANTLRHMVKDYGYNTEVNEAILDNALFGKQDWELTPDE